MATWVGALARTRRQIAGVLARVVGGGKRPDEATLEELEEWLLRADVPARLVGGLIEDLRQLKPDRGGAERGVLRTMLIQSLDSSEPFSWQDGQKPLSILILGVNGSGKTTTSAKLARTALRTGRSALLGATDTFRAAGADQLRIWADRIGCDVVAGAPGADAAAVAYDALEAAIARGADVVILDTAGRMHTKQPLMQELQKVARALEKRKKGAPDETWLVLDASMGHNALVQARAFHEAVPLTGVVVAKLDGSSKAGFVFAIAQELGVPVRYVGLGEGEDDLVPFDPESFVDALLGTEHPPLPVPSKEGTPLSVVPDHVGSDQKRFPSSGGVPEGRGGSVCESDASEGVEH